MIDDVANVDTDLTVECGNAGVKDPVAIELDEFMAAVIADNAVEETKPAFLSGKPIELFPLLFALATKVTT